MTQRVFQTIGGRQPLRRRQRGLTLVEILVTAVIVSVGLLGVAALHLTSLRNSFDSNNRSKAVWIAHEIQDRMRANRNSARSGEYSVVMGANLVGTSLAAADVQGWKSRLAQELANGDGSIAVLDIGSSKLFTITIQWTERGSNTPVTFVTQTEI